MRMVFGGFIFKDSIKREGETIKLFSFEQIVTKVQKEWPRIGQRVKLSEKNKSICGRLRN